MPRFIDLSRQKFGRLTVISRAEKGPRAWWSCKCDCGTEKVLSATSLRDGTVSCGCWAAEKHLKRVTKHGHAPTTGKPQSGTYATWRGIRQRCMNQNNLHYADYGGRGIKVCDRWLHFENFLADMGVRPDGLEIDRVNNDGDYCKDNCIWTSHSQNNRHTRANRFLELDSKRACIAEWSEITGIGWFTINARIKNGWSIEKALKTPVHKSSKKPPILSGA